MSAHELDFVMTTHDRQRRFVCTCGESGSAVPDEGYARAEHQRHAAARDRLSHGQPPVLGRSTKEEAVPDSDGCEHPTVKRDYVDGVCSWRCMACDTPFVPKPRRILCAHADRNGEGMHWKWEGEPCPTYPFGFAVSGSGEEWNREKAVKAALDEAHTPNARGES